MPKIGGSQLIPTIAPAPPAAREKKTGDQFCSSPMRRRRVTARVITEGTRISDFRDAFWGVVIRYLLRSIFSAEHPDRQGLYGRSRDRRAGGRRVHVGAVVRAIEHETTHVERHRAGIGGGAAHGEAAGVLEPGEGLVEELLGHGVRDVAA